MSPAELVAQYFKYFNEGQREGMISLLHPEIEHEINQGTTQKGLEQFKKFMQHMDDCYKEVLVDITIMSPTFLNANGSENTQKVSAEFIVNGTYLKTDPGLPEARNQKYSIRAGSFFEVRNQKISRVTTYYNLPAWIKAVQLSNGV